MLQLAGIAPAIAGDRIGDIEFFGYKGIDVSKLRQALPLHEGDDYTDQTKTQLRQAVAAAIGKQPTEVAAVCCDDNGNRLLFIGLPGASYRPFAYSPEPSGDARLSPDILSLYSRLDAALEAAVRKGGDAPQEDDSNGYALVNDPDARSLQLAVRHWALDKEQHLLQVLQFSSDAQHRRVASDALGYARQSRGQILGLVQAARDPDGDVRNNATRALSVLVRSNGELASEIPPDAFIEMLNSGVWTDRNKATGLLAQLTDRRDPNLLANVRSKALDSVIEMASWRRPGHAYYARMLLGRIAGLPEDQLNELAWNGPVETLVQALDGR